MKNLGPIAALAIAILVAAPAASRDQAQPSIDPRMVLAEETLLAGPGLRGRGSATPDEAIAAGYVASLFRDFGLQRAPGMDSYLQPAALVRRSVAGEAVLQVAGKKISGVTLLMTGGGTISGKAVIVADPNGEIPAADVVVYTGPADALTTVSRKLRSKGVKLVIAADSDVSRKFLNMIGGKPALPTTVEGMPSRRPAMTLATISGDLLTGIAAGSDVSIDVPVATSKAVTTNAIGYLPGTDPKAGVILLSAHLDHLGVRPDGTVMPGANDDASGTVAVIELARAFAAMGRQKRGILFVAYGSEEIGGLGSTWFGEHPPIPLSDLVANIEFEMIGAQDPKLPKGALMMTGSERSNLFDMMKSQGALIASDPYPDQHFFERSDNYSLALKGIVAHTFSGWAVVPTYHQPTDTIENLDIGYMANAIRSLVAPIRLLASGGFKPEWKAEGRPRP
jgi:hypothetical protein